MDDSRSSDTVVSIFVGIDPSDGVGISTTAARRELGIPENHSVITFVGRLSEEKRPDWIVRLAEDAPASTTVLVVGDGPLSSILSEATDRDLPLVWHRNLPNIQTPYTAANVVVLPSRVEGIPLTMLEALDAGVSVVATAVGGIPELGDLHGVNVVPSRDYTAFADTTFAIAVDPTDSVILPSRYSRDTMAAEYDRIIDPLPRRG